LGGIFDRDDSYGQPGHASTWYLRASRTKDGVFREHNHVMVDEDFGKDPIDLGEDSSDEESDESDDVNGVHDEL
jgi:hypothetical protein